MQAGVRRMALRKMRCDSALVVVGLLEEDKGRDDRFRYEE